MVSNGESLAGGQVCRVLWFPDLPLVGDDHNRQELPFYSGKRVIIAGSSVERAFGRKQEKYPGWVIASATTFSPVPDADFSWPSCGAAQLRVVCASSLRKVFHNIFSFSSL
jgi:hypothetical protein